MVFCLKILKMMLYIDAFLAGLVVAVCGYIMGKGLEEPLENKYTYQDLSSMATFFLVGMGVHWYVATSKMAQ